MKNVIVSAVLVLSACASNPPPEACPRCYSIDEVAPYEPPHRVVIICADPPDAGAAPAEDAGECGEKCVPFVENEYPPPKSDDPFARVF